MSKNAMETMMPHNLDAERGVLGSLIIDPEAMDQVVGFLRADDFYRNAHRLIYEVIVSLHQQRTEADFITICHELERRKHLKDVGGPGSLTSLINAVPTSGHVLYYAQIVQRTSLFRQLIAASGEIAQLGYEADDVTVALDQAERLIFALSQQSRLAQPTDRSMSEAMADYMMILEERYQRRGQVVGVPTGYVDLDYLLGGLQRSDLDILAARTSIGKCLIAHTLIDDPVTGERLTIEQCVRRRQSLVYGISEEGKIRSTAVTDWIDSGIQPCYRVRTRLGRMVETTGHHPFLTVHGWVPLHDLAVGNRIAVPTSVPIFGKDESWSLDMVRLLAYFIAEGGLTDSSPKFTNTDPVIVEDFKQAIATHFPVCALRRVKITYSVAQPRNATTLRGGAILPKNPVTIWLKGLGLMGKLSRYKYVPLCVWQWSRRHLAEFLKALMSCDGFIYSCGGRPYIELTLSSQHLAYDVQHAFTRFGIISKCYQKKASCRGKPIDVWRVEITNPESVRIYREEIGWIGEKATRFAEYKRSVLREDGGNRGHAPKETWKLVRAAIQQQGLSLRELARRSGETTRQGKYAGHNPQTGRNIPRYRLAAYAEVLDDPVLRSIASPDIYWDEIVSIEYVGEHQVYDLTVPDGSNFVAQDIIVHNTTLALNIAYNAAITFKQKVGIFSLEMSATQLMERFVSIDSGMDQHKLRTGRLEEEDWPDLIAAGERLSALGIWMDDQAGMPLIEMRSRARRWVAEQGVELLIVDYLQLIDSREEQKRENREQEVSRISRGLKNIARELNIPVLALAQLSRAVESRQSKVPQLSDLRESGSIEQEADVVMFIYRDEVYNPETERPHQADIIVAKHRAGPQGTVTLYFDQQHSRFANLDTALDPDGEEMVFAAEEEEGVPEVLMYPPEEEDGEVE